MVRSLFNNLQPIINWLYSSVPSFPVRADQVSVLYKPEEFYETLINSCSKATSRILFVSLYLGTGEKEKRLVNVILSKLGETGSSIKVKILLDAVRSSRGPNNSSRKILLPLLQQSSRCQVALFHSPKLKGLLHRFLPPRYNELIGLQHMKIYIIDNNILISGANLSHDYFTNRQDRYVLVKDCKPLADFFEGMIDILCSMSLQLTRSDDTVPPAKYHPYEKSNLYTNQLRKRLSDYYASFINNNGKVEDADCDTLIFPTIEVPPCDIHIDSQTVKQILELAPKNSLVHLASGYFNLTKSYINTILNSKAEYTLLMAHPTANGFYQSSGLSRYIPDLYTAIGKQFYEIVEQKDNIDRITMFEFQKRDWTFHGKGIWITFPGEILPQLTVVGSSNFGARSESRDLESQIIIVTDNFELRKQLYREQRQLFDYGSLFTRTVFLEPERKVSFWINGLAWLLKSFF